MLFFKHEENVLPVLCRECAFFSYVNAENYEDERGYCRRNPPAKNQVITTEDNFCGEFRPDGGEI